MNKKNLVIVIASLSIVCLALLLIIGLVITANLTKIGSQIKIKYTAYADVVYHVDDVYNASLFSHEKLVADTAYNVVDVVPIYNTSDTDSLGYTFLGWYTNVARTNEFINGTKVSGVVNLYPKFAKANIPMGNMEVSDNTYTINSLTPTNITSVNSGSVVTISNAVVVPDYVKVSGEYFPVTTITDKTLDLTGNYKSYYIGNNVNSIQPFFLGDGVTNPDIPLFTGTLFIGRGLTTIPEKAFYDYNKITSLKFANGCHVTTVKDGGFARLVSIPGKFVMPPSIQVLEVEAFRRWESLTELVFPSDSQLTTIGARAFADYLHLKSFTLPKNVSSLGLYVLGNTNSLTSLQVDNDNQYFDDYNSNIIVDKTTNTLISGCNYSTIPEGKGITAIADLAFQYVTKLETLVIPEGITSIGDSAFEQCWALSNLYLNTSVWNISLGDAFKYCNSLKAVFIVKQTDKSYSEYFNSITFINDYSTPLCNGAKLLEYKSIYTADDTQDLPAYLFYKHPIVTEVTISNKVTEISEFTFAECGKMLTLKFEENSTLKTINSDAFLNCKALNGTITIPSSVETIGARAFRECTSVDSIIFPSDSNLTTIENRAFADIRTLQSIHLPSKLSFIGEYAFGNCRDMSYITIDANNPNYKDYGSNIIVDTRENEVVFGCSTSVIPADKGIKTIGSYSFYYSYLTTFTIPEGVTKIESQAFRASKILTSITLPNSLEIIEDRVFVDNPLLQSINIPANVSSIGENLFGQCTKLSAITIDDNNPNYKDYDSNIIIDTRENKVIAGCYTSVIPANKGVTSIGSYAFCNISQLKTFTIPEGITTIDVHAFRELANLSSISIPSTLQNIGDYCFFRCTSLTSITIPASITNMGQYVFSECTKLKSVQLLDTTSTYYYSTTISIDDGTALSASIIASPSSLAAWLTNSNNLKYYIIKN